MSATWTPGYWGTSPEYELPVPSALFRLDVGGGGTVAQILHLRADLRISVADTGLWGGGLVAGGEIEIARFGSLRLDGWMELAVEALPDNREPVPHPNKPGTTLYPTVTVGSASATGGVALRLPL